MSYLGANPAIEVTVANGEFTEVKRGEHNRIETALHHVMSAAQDDEILRQRWYYRILDSLQAFRKTAGKAEDFEIHMQACCFMQDALGLPVADIPAVLGFRDNMEKNNPEIIQTWIEERIDFITKSGFPKNEFLIREKLALPQSKKTLSEAMDFGTIMPRMLGGYFKHFPDTAWSYLARTLDVSPGNSPELVAKDPKTWLRECFNTARVVSNFTNYDFFANPLFLKWVGEFWTNYPAQTQELAREINRESPGISTISSASEQDLINKIATTQPATKT